ncbi:hypothetical protein AF335_21695 [Streptomyces eurocidicus]|uniref:Neocarzinostatin family protein n=1 Tax=Streptomyces eurocidicus TaxID=66423 RepID=A0A2N8NT53_STREU|nr:hypothetical protein AF335_21695 [Streptomyces eurocidicus]
MPGARRRPRPESPYSPSRGYGRDGRPRRRRRPGRLRAGLVAALLAAAPLAPPPAGRAVAADGAVRTPAVTLDRKEAGKGGSLTVSGTGWRPGTLLTLLVCGQNMIGGTNACANADGRTATTGAGGAFRTTVPVAAPPKPCPCVVHVATVTGEAAAVDAPFAVAGHPVAPLPRRTGGERLGVLGARLEGSSGILTWFGAPPRRRLVLTVGNLGTTAAENPVFQVGTSHGVLAPGWEERRWRGTVPAGQRAKVALDVELAAGAYGDYLVSLKYGDKLLVEEPWDVSRPWGVTLFWILLGLVVPAGLFRAGMAVVDRLRPGPGPGTGLGTGPGPGAAGRSGEADRADETGRTGEVGRPDGARTGKAVKADEAGRIDSADKSGRPRTAREADRADGADGPGEADGTTGGGNPRTRRALRTRRQARKARKAPPGPPEPPGPTTPPAAAPAAPTPPSSPSSGAGTGVGTGAGAAPHPLPWFTPGSAPAPPREPPEPPRRTGPGRP